MQPIEEGEEQLQEVNNILPILQKLSRDQFAAELTTMPKQIREIFSWIFFIPAEKLPLQMSILQQLIDYSSDKTNYTQIKDSIKSLNLNHLDLIESRLKITPVSMFQQYIVDLKARAANMRSSSPITNSFLATSSQLSPTTQPTHPPFATLRPTATYTTTSTGPLPQLFPLNTNVRPAYFAESTFPVSNNENSNNTQSPPLVNTTRYVNDYSQLPLNASVSSLTSEGDSSSYLYNSDVEEQEYPSSPTRYITDPKSTSKISIAPEPSGYHETRNNTPKVANPIVNTNAVSVVMPTDNLADLGYSNGYSNIGTPPMSSSGHIKFSHFVDAVYKFCSDTEKFSGDIKLNGFKWGEHKDSQGNTVTAILVSLPEAEKSWGKGEGEVHSEFESYGFFHSVADAAKRTRYYWLEIGNVSEISLLRRSNSMVQPKSSLVKMTLKEVNDAWLNVVLKSFDGKEQIKEMSMKLLSSDELRQDDSKIFTGGRRINLKHFIEYQKQSAPQTPNILACWYNISLILDSYTVNGELTLMEFLRFLNQFGSWNMLLSVIESLFDSTTGVSHAYFGKISVKEAWSILRVKPHGSFLLRDPTSDGNILTASFITSKGQLEHAKIWRSSSNLYFIPEEKNTKVKKFSTIGECIKAFSEFKEAVRTPKQWLPVVMTSPRPMVNNSSSVLQSSSTELRRSLGSSASSMLNFDSPRISGVTMPEHLYNADVSHVNMMTQSSASVAKKSDPVLEFVCDALGSEGLKDTNMVREIVPSLLAQYNQYAGLPKPTSTDVEDLVAKIRLIAVSMPKNSNMSEIKDTRSTSNINFAVPALNLSFGSVQDASMVSPHGNIYNNSMGANNTVPSAPKSGKKIERKVVVDGYYEDDEL